MNKNQKIYIITTKGCAGCNIMIEIAKKLSFDTYFNAFYIQDISDIPQYIKVDVLLDDFPTIVFVDGYDIVYYHTGTLSKNKLKEKMVEYEFISPVLP